MRSAPKILAAFPAAALLALAACTSTPEAPPQQDATAKQFLTHPNASTIYVYRSPFNHLDYDSVLYVNGRLIGSTVPGTYFRVDTVPGRNVLHGSGVDVGQIVLDTRPGEIYIVSLDVLGGHSNFHVLSGEVGRKRIRDCCVLLENWAPGQRPLLR